MKYITFLSAKCVSVSLAILGLLLSAIACDDKEYGDAMSEGQLMNDIEMNIESSIALAVGMDIQVICKSVPENVTYPELSWKSSDENIVSVSQEGKITAKAVGKAKVNISQKAAFETLKTIDVEVKPVATAIEMDDFELFEGTTKKASVKITPSNGYNVFHWKSSNEEIVKVDADGTVTGIIPGEAVVTAIATDGTSLTVSAKVTVRKVIPVESIQLDPVDDIMIGQTVVIGCHLVPEEATSGLLSWVSSDEKVAVVDADGAVTGVGYGTVTITATDPMSNISATTSVTVGALLDYQFQSTLKPCDLKPNQGGTVTFDNGYAHIIMKGHDGNGNWRQDINIVNDAYQKKLEYAPQTYKYLAIKLRRPQQSATANAGVLKFDIGDGVTAGNYCNSADYYVFDKETLTIVKKGTGVEKYGEPNIYVYDMSVDNAIKGSSPILTNEAGVATMTLLSLWIADVKEAAIDKTYDMYWIKTFKTLEDLKAYIEKENNK